MISCELYFVGTQLEATSDATHFRDRSQGRHPGHVGMMDTGEGVVLHLDGGEVICLADPEDHEGVPGPITHRREEEEKGGCGG